jgi:hypothetical protein
VEAACAQFVVLCRQLNLFTRAIVAIDVKNLRFAIARGFCPQRLESRHSRRTAGRQDSARSGVRRSNAPM